METLGIIFVVSVIIYFSVLSYKRTASRNRGEQALDIASVWLNKNGIDRNKVSFFPIAKMRWYHRPGQLWS
jgi:hypothetical protein